MTAGLNSLIQVWRINYDDDNVIGGAVVTGTPINTYYARIQAMPESQLLLQQGLETERTFTATIVPGSADIRERDEIEVIDPYDNVYHGARFRVRGVSYSTHSTRDPRNYMLLTLSRVVRSRARQ